LIALCVVDPGVPWPLHTQAFYTLPALKIGRAEAAIMNGNTL
jgi:hypothetical protein